MPEQIGISLKCTNQVSYPPSSFPRPLPSTPEGTIEPSVALSHLSPSPRHPPKNSSILPGL